MKRLVIGIIAITLVVGFVPIIEVQYQDVRELNYAISGWYERELVETPDGYLGVLPIFFTVVENTDSIRGIFTLRNILEYYEDWYDGEQVYEEHIKETPLELDPGQAEIVEVSALDIDTGWFDEEKNGWGKRVEVIPEIKMVTDYKKVPIFQYLRSRFQA